RHAAAAPDQRQPGRQHQLPAGHVDSAAAIAPAVDPGVLLAAAMRIGSCARSIVLALAAAIAATNPAGARGAASDRQLVVGPNVLVSGANRDVPHMEVIACANRGQPSTLLVASMASRRGRTVTVLYQSADAGATWTPVLETVGAGLMGD